jgi:tRNA(Ile)-lysidine synthase
VVNLPARALRTIRKHGMLSPGSRVLVALSGGPDSVALLRILRTLASQGELTLAGVAHVNHLLRGADSDEDERFCRELSASVALPIAVKRVDVAGLARKSTRSIEATARLVRYRFFEAAAAGFGADVVAVGHTLDDQAETFLMRLLRGAGARGLGSIRPLNGRVIRPLLEVGRAELRDYAVAEGLTFREDASNRDVTILRNRVRHELLPHLEQFSPAVADRLARAADLAREDEEYLGRLAIEAATSIVLSTEPGVDAAKLMSLPRALASRVARLALERSAGERFIGSGHIEGMLELAAGADGASLSLPGLTLTRLNGRILFGTALNSPFSNSFRFPLSIPGEVSSGGWTVSAEPLDPGGEIAVPPARGAVAVVPEAALKFPLAVRSRRRGDRFRPLGMGGQGRKLQDFLVDRKIARQDRDSLPLVVDRDDGIVWVVGQSVAEDFRITSPLRGVILLKAKRLGGVG